MTGITKIVRRLRQQGVSLEQISELGGLVGSDGRNVTFAKDTKGYEKFADKHYIADREQRQAAKQFAMQELMKRVGPPLWKQIHVGALTVEPEKFNDVLDEVKRALPCGKCKNELRRIRKATPPPLTTKEANFAWSVETLHNAVNVELGKATMSVGEALEIYDQNRSAGSSMSTV